MNDTYWEHNGQRITLDEVKRFIDWHKISAEPIPVDVLVPLATAKNIQYSTSRDPIIAIARNGKPTMILDGHHRVQQAHRANDAYITGYVININLVPSEWRSAIAS